MPENDNAERGNRRIDLHCPRGPTGEQEGLKNSAMDVCASQLLQRSNVPSSSSPRSQWTREGTSSRKWPRNTQLYGIVCFSILPDCPVPSRDARPPFLEEGSDLGIPVGEQRSSISGNTSRQCARLKFPTWLARDGIAPAGLPFSLFLPRRRNSLERKICCRGYALGSKTRDLRLLPASYCAGQ